jgi:hypothetical protein
MSVFLQPIYTQTVGAGGIGELSFTNIPQTFTDLKIVISARIANAAAANTLYIGINGAYSSTTSRYLAGDGTSVTSSISGSALIGDVSANSATANTFGSVEVYIPNYRSSNFKQYISDSVSENNTTSAFTEMWAGLWSSTSAITALKFSASANMMQYSTITIYGITKG